MQYKILHELDISNSETHILATIADKIIINNSFNGIILLNNALMTIANLELLDNLKTDRIFQKDTGTEFLLYSLENKCLIHIPLSGYKHTVIPLPDELSNQLLIPIYDWEHEKPILTTKDNLYEVDVFNQQVMMLASTSIQENHLTFYKVWDTWRAKDVLFYDQDEKAFLALEDTTLIFGDYNLMRKRRVIKKMDEAHAYIIDTDYKKGRLIVVHEHELGIVDLDSDRRLVIKAPSPYTFSHAQFLGDSDNKIAVLHNDTAKKKHALLQIIEISGL